MPMTNYGFSLYKGSEANKRNDSTARAGIMEAATSDKQALAREEYFLATPSRGVSELELDRLEIRLLDQLLMAKPQAESRLALYRAANEAAALAWMTPFPLLVLPSLLEEMVQAARHRAQRQKEIFRQSQGFVDQAYGWVNIGMRSVNGEESPFAQAQFLACLNHRQPCRWTALEIKPATTRRC